MVGDQCWSGKVSSSTGLAVRGGLKVELLVMVTELEFSTFRDVGVKAGCIWMDAVEFRKDLCVTTGAPLQVAIQKRRLFLPRRENNVGNLFCNPMRLSDEMRYVWRMLFLGLSF